MKKDYQRMTEKAKDGSPALITEMIFHEFEKLQGQGKRRYYTDSDVLNIVIKYLAELEDKIENGTLIELPCKVWDKVYMPWEFYGECGIAILSVEEIEISRQSIFTNLKSDDLDFLRKYNHGAFYFDEVGKKVFLTKPEAEAKLKELQGDRV